MKPELFARHLVNALGVVDVPDLFILCLQEVAPITYSFLGGSYLDQYFGSLRRAVHIASASLDNVRFVHIITKNVGMTAIILFALEKNVQNVKWLETAGVGVGIQEMGNKGAAGVRIGYSTPEQVMELSMVSAHLAPMEGALERRNEDWRSIVQRLVFTSVNPNCPPSVIRHQRPCLEEDSDNAPLLQGTWEIETPESGVYTPTSHLILAGDLNYRTSSVKPSLLDYQKFPRPTNDHGNSYHYSKLLQNDQLHLEIKAERTCHGLHEAPIDFPPTYKYSDEQRAMADADDGRAWDWAKHRWPSWCDRILYLDLPPWMKDKCRENSMQAKSYTALPLMSTSDHRPVVLSLSIPLEAISVPVDEVAESNIRCHPPFAIDPRWREKRIMARRREIVIGLAAYLGFTWEGNSILLAIVLGALGGWVIIRGMLEI